MTKQFIFRKVNDDMEMYLIRHGQSEANAKRMHAGWAPVELTEMGRDEARQIVGLMENIHFDKVIVSDLVRTKQTAELALPGYMYELEDKIREINVGSLAYHTVEECCKTLGQTYLEADMASDYTPYGGESDDAIAARVAAFMKQMEAFADKTESCKKVAVVCHLGPIYHMLCYVLGCRFEKSAVIIKNCSVSKLSYTDGRWKLECWNYTGPML